jgi:hypothetical protein
MFIDPVCRDSLTRWTRTCREFANLAAPALFQQLRLADDLLQDKGRRKVFLMDTLPLIASHVRLLSLMVRMNSPDEDIAGAVSQLQNVTWVSLCIESEDRGTKTLAALEALPDVRKLTLHIRLSHENTVVQRLMEAHANRITALYLHFDWGYITDLMRSSYSGTNYRD